tara:strand:+ start:1162 stop:1443 length:282 start_codon:yes stop_codon:yes gene_type:complete
MSNPEEPRQVSIMFTDTSTRDYVITAGSVKECEDIFDMLWLHKEHSIDDLVKQYNVKRKANVWVNYQCDKDIVSIEDDNMYDPGYPDRYELEE